jgi:hypothetical protein
MCLPRGELRLLGLLAGVLCVVAAAAWLVIPANNEARKRLAFWDRSQLEITLERTNAFLGGAVALRARGLRPRELSSVRAMDRSGHWHDVAVQRADQYGTVELVFSPSVVVSAGEYRVVVVGQDSGLRGEQVLTFRRTASDQVGSPSNLNADTRYSADRALWRVLPEEAARAYWAGLDAASRGDWAQAAIGFYKALSVEPGFQEAASRLEEARSRIGTEEDCSRCRLIHGEGQ